MNGLPIIAPSAEADEIVALLQNLSAPMARHCNGMENSLHYLEACLQSVIIRLFMKIFFIIVLLLLKSAFADAHHFQLDNEKKWRAKDNVHLICNQERIRVEIDTSQFNYGWFRSPIPLGENDKIKGFAGRIRLVSGRNASFKANIVLFRENVHYHQQAIMHLVVANSQWHEFYLPIDKFDPTNGTISRLKAAELAEGDNLQLFLEKLQDTVVIELDSLRVVLETDSQEELKRLSLLNLHNRLRNESTVHPKILLKGEFLEQVRQKATAGGLEQIGYETLIKWADAYMQNVDEKEPLKAVLAFQNNSEVNFQKNRGAFEKLLTDASIPLEILAAAGLITQDDRYSRKAAMILVKMAETLDVDSPELKYGFYYTRTQYIRALALGYDWCHEFLTTEQQKTVKTTLLGFILDIYRRCWVEHWGRHPLQRTWNWNPGLVSCAGLGLLALEGETYEPEAAMLFEFRRHLHDYLTLGIDFDGACLEGPSYINYGIGCGPFFMETLRQQGRGDLFIDTNAHLIAPWLVFEMLPGRKSWNNLSDCNKSLPSAGQFYHYAMGRYAQLAQNELSTDEKKWPSSPVAVEPLDYIQHFPERPGERHLSYSALGRLLSWAWSAGPLFDNLRLMDARLALVNTLFFRYVQPIDNPAEYLPEALHFRGRGLAISRIGFGEDSLHLAVEAGPHAAGHDQADKGSFTLYGYGQGFFIDSGYGNDGEQHKSSSSHAHNMVLIDGKGQHLSPYHNNSGAVITGYSHSKEWDWIRVDAADAWNIEQFNDLEPFQTNAKVKRYERQFLLLRPMNNHPPCLVISDDICKNDETPHTFSWLWHFDPSLKIIEENGVVSLVSDQDKRPMLTTDDKMDDASASFTFTAPADNDYKLIGLTAALGTSIGQSDSFFYRINDENPEIWDISPTMHFSWSEIKSRGELLPRKFHLKSNEKITVHLHKRETGAALAKMALIPYNSHTEASPEQVFNNGLVQSISDAIQDENKPFLLSHSAASNDSEANATMFIVGTPEGANKCDWFETSREGIHKRFIHSVTNTRNPHFLMLIVLRRNKMQPLPSVTKLATGSLVLQWPDGQRQKISFDHLALPTVQ